MALIGSLPKAAYKLRDLIRQVVLRPSNPRKIDGLFGWDVTGRRYRDHTPDGRCVACVLGLLPNATHPFAMCPSQLALDQSFSVACSEMWRWFDMQKDGRAVVDAIWGRASKRAKNRRKSA